MNAPGQLFTDLSRLPCTVYINIGLESADQETLDLLGKPITTSMVECAFARIQDINGSFLRLVRDSFSRPKPKGCIYLPVLKFNSLSRELVFEFNGLKLLSRLPTYLYIIQRL